MIPWFNSYISKSEKKQAFELILKNNLSEGRLLALFENKIGNLIRNKNVTVTNSASISLYICLLSLSLKKGDEVIMTNRSWISTFHAAKLLNLKVNFVDVDIKNENIDENLIEKLINKKTKVLIIVNRNGRICNRKKINRIVKKHNLFLIEDCAQSFLSKQKDFINNKADYSCFSFGPTKLLNIGQGGAIISKNNKMHKIVQAIKYNGLKSKKDGVWSKIGFNFKFTDIQCAFGLVQLKNIRKKISRLREINKLILKNTNQNKNFTIIKNKYSEVPLYTEALCANRSKLIKYLAKNKIECSPYYNSLSDSPLADKSRYISVNNNSQKFKKNGLWLLSGSSQKNNDILKMCKLINNFYNKN